MNPAMVFQLFLIITLYTMMPSVRAVGLWQSSPLYEKGNTTPPGETAGYRYRMLDTGGTGGMFGKGDIHSGLRSVDFWDEKTGWAAGEGGVFRTDDGGLTWQRSLPATKAPAIWWKVRMRGPRDIWVLKRFHGQSRAELFRSRDDGDTWEQVLQGRLRGASDLQVRGPVIYVLCGDSTSYRSTDGGETWSEERFGGLLHGTAAISEPGDTSLGHGYRLFVLGHFNKKIRLIRSDDSGQTWQVIALPVARSVPYPRAVMFFSTSVVGGIGLQNGMLLFTTDGGQSWSLSTTVSGKGVTALWMDDSGRGFFATENNNPASPGLALSHADFRKNVYTAAQTASVEFREITGERQRLWAVGKVVSVIPNDAVLLIDSE